MATYRALVFVLVLLCCGAALPVEAAADRFTDNGDGTITDHQLNLMWAKTDNQGDIDWHQARKWVTFTFPLTLQTSYDNWRLPTLQELQSLVAEPGYETDCGLEAHIIPLIRLTCGWVWTAESDATAPTARVFNFDNIYHYTVRMAHRRGYRALAVRSIVDK
ncbi:MAG: DUF1566 domain-containing protein [Desulfobacteraceae bacterium]